MQLAPWLQPPDYLQSIDRGAQLGLDVRRADLEQAAQQQRAQQAAAELRQSWAVKMLENQRMTEQNRLTTESNQLYRSGMLDARNRGLDIQETKAGQPQRQQTYSPGQGYIGPDGKVVIPIPKPEVTDFTPGTPVDFGNGVMALETSEGHWTRLPTTPGPKPLTLGDRKEFSDLTLATQVVTPASKLPQFLGGTPATTNYSTANLTPYQKTRLSDLRSQADAYSAGTNAPARSLQTNSVTPSPAGQPQLAPPLSLTNSPAAGTLTNSPSATVALGGYQIGRRYAGKTYLGGNPNDQTSWK